MRDMMEKLAESGRPVARHKELWLFDSPSATQRKWPRSKRMLKLKAKGGRQQTLGDCGIGPGACPGCRTGGTRAVPGARCNRTHG